MSTTLIATQIDRIALIRFIRDDSALCSLRGSHSQMQRRNDKSVHPGYEYAGPPNLALENGCWPNVGIRGAIWGSRRLAIWRGNCKNRMEEPCRDGRIASERKQPPGAAIFFNALIDKGMCRFQGAVRCCIGVVA
jgi:hypothetical protein